MEIFIIVLLVLTGFLLILLEFLVIPGIAVAGIGGVIFMTGGILYSYKELGAAGGNITLVVTLITFAAAIVIAFRSKTWNKAMLNTEIDGHVDQIEVGEVQIGDIGKTVSRLAPMGKVKINGKVFEGKSISGYIDPNIEIEVMKLQNTNVIVKLINNKT